MVINASYQFKLFSLNTSNKNIEKRDLQAKAIFKLSTQRWQITLPQSLQWCRLYVMLNFFSQFGQNFTSLSFSQGTTDFSTSINKVKVQGLNKTYFHVA